MELFTFQMGLSEVIELLDTSSLANKAANASCADIIFMKPFLELRHPVGTENPPMADVSAQFTPV